MKVLLKDVILFSPEQNLDDTKGAQTEPAGHPMDRSEQFTSDSAFFRRDHRREP